MFRVGYVEIAPLTAGGGETYDRPMKTILESVSVEVGLEIVRFVNYSSAPGMGNEALGAMRYRKPQHSTRSRKHRLMRALGFRASGWARVSRLVTRENMGSALESGFAKNTGRFWGPRITLHLKRFDWENPRLFPQYTRTTKFLMKA